MIPKCVICGFSRAIQKHHIVPVMDFGSDDEDNLVYLCLNHHWMADFGRTEERLNLKNLIRKKTGKIGDAKTPEQIEELKRKILVLCESDLGETFPESISKTENYATYKKIFLGRNISTSIKIAVNSRAEELLSMKTKRKSLEGVF